MKNLSQTAQRRSRTAGRRGFASSRTHHTFRSILAAGASLVEACRAIGRRAADASRRGAEALASTLVPLGPWRSLALVPIPIDASSAKIRRSRMNHRR